MAQNDAQGFLQCDIGDSEFGGAYIIRITPFLKVE